MGYNLVKDCNESVDLVITVGGDGTFLRQVKCLDFPSITFVGINTGHLGFYQEISVDEIDYFIESLNNKEYHIREIHPLKFIINEDNKQLHNSLNEVVFKNIYGKTMHAGIYIGSDFIESFSGDGIIVSSTIGSTAYNYSAGGSLIDSRIDLLQVTPISPLNSNAYRCITTGIILPSDSIIKLVPHSRNRNGGQIFADGFKIKSGRISNIEISYDMEKTIKLMSFGKYKFWKKVKEKFL